MEKGLEIIRELQSDYVEMKDENLAWIDKLQANMPEYVESVMGCYTILGEFNGELSKYKGTKLYEEEYKKCNKHLADAQENLWKLDEMIADGEQLLLGICDKTLSVVRNMKETSRESLRWASSSSTESYYYKRELQLLEELEDDILEQYSNLSVKLAGREGERKVEYALKWLSPGGYESIAKDCMSKYLNVCIMLQNNEFIREPQEFDHIVVGKNGIFLIETKNYAGKITVTRNGDWLQEKNDVCKGIKNPVQQCDRHSAVLKSIIGSVPITSIICIANDGVIIEGRENCDIPIVNVSLLQRFIENSKTEQNLTKEKIDEILWKINKHKVFMPF